MNYLDRELAHRETEVLGLARPPRRRSERPGEESGQALIEFALVLPVLILIVVGIIDFGFAFNQWNTAQNAAREGARIAAVSNSEATIKNRANVSGGTVGLLATDITLSCNRPARTTPFTTARRISTAPGRAPTARAPRRELERARG